MPEHHRSPVGGEGTQPAVPSRPRARLRAGGWRSARALFLRALVFAGALGAGLVATEIALRAASEHALLVLDVEMWRYARRIKTPSAVPGLVEEHRPHAEARLMGVTVRTDGDGFRRPGAAVEAARRPGERRVAVLGDSLTLGWGVPESRTYAARLETLLRERCPDDPVTVANAGVGNSNTAMQLARYDHRVRAFGPEWLILGYFLNDAEPDPRPADHPLLWHSSLAALLTARLAQGMERDLRDYRAYYAGLYEEGRPGWLATRHALGELGRRLVADGVAATLLLLPEMHRPGDQGPFAAAYDRVAALGRDAGFEVIDAAPAFPPGAGDRYWVTSTDPHPNAAGHEIFAGALLGSRHACPAADDPD